MQLAPIDVVVGSRARHTAAEELAVPVDIFPAEQLAQQGSTETSVILQAVSPSINFPRQSVTDAGDIVRPFTLRGLSPDHTLVLLNGWRRHQTALVNNFTYGMGAGSSGVDLNAIPSSALDRIEVLRDGAAAQYGSDAIAGVVNLVLKDGVFTPFVNGDVGRYTTDNYPDDGTTVERERRLGHPASAEARWGLFGEFRDRQPTNRAWADAFEVAGTGVADSINDIGQVVHKNNPVPQPNHHWGDGLEKDALAFANFRHAGERGGQQRDLRLRRLQPPRRQRQSATGATSTARATGSRSIRSASCPIIEGLVDRLLDGRRAPRASCRAGTTTSAPRSGTTTSTTRSATRSTRRSGPCLDVAVRTRSATGSSARRTIPAFPTRPRSSPAGCCARSAIAAAQHRQAGRAGAARTRSTWRSARRSGGSATRSGPGELASYVNGGATDQNGDGAGARRSQSFPGFAPGDETDRHRTNFGLYADAESQLSEKVLADVAARFEDYSDFGSRVSGKAAVRFQPSRRVTLRGAVSTGFRAPGLSQIAFSKVVTNVIAGQFIDVGLFPVDNPASLALGAKPLRDETSVNLSAGIVVTPVDNLTITADYFHITDQQPDPARRHVRRRRPRWTSWPTRASATSAACSTSPTGWTPGPRASTSRPSYKVPAGRSGTLDLNAGFNYTKNKITHVDPLPQVLVDAGSTEPGLLDSVTAIGIQDERPDWRGTLQANYTVGRVSALGRFSYFGGFSSAQPGLLRPLPRQLRRQGSDGRRARLPVQPDQARRSACATCSTSTRTQPSSQVVVDDAGDTAKDFNDNFGTFPWAAASPFGYNGRFVYARTEIQLWW